MGIMLKPFGARVAVRLDDPVGASKGGILIPERAKSLPAEGTIVAVGDGDADCHPVPLSVGWRVVVSKYGGHTVRYGGEDIQILSLGDILAILPGDDLLPVEAAQMAIPIEVVELESTREREYHKHERVDTSAA